MTEEKTAPASTPAAKVTPEEYHEAMEAAQVINLRLIKSEFVVEPEGLGRDRSQWKPTYDFKVRDVAFDPTRTLLTALVSGEAGCKVGRKRIIALRSRYLIAYRVTGNPTESAAMSFARRVSAFAAYPYFRAHFAEACSQAGIDLPPLPIMKEPKRPIPPATG